jgi:hypothetical protein
MTTTLSDAMAKARHEMKFAGHGPATDALRGHCQESLVRLLEASERALKAVEDLSLTPLYDSSRNHVGIEDCGRFINDLRTAIDKASIIEIHTRK